MEQLNNLAKKIGLCGYLRNKTTRLLIGFSESDLDSLADQYIQRNNIFKLLVLKVHWKHAYLKNANEKIAKQKRRAIMAGMQRSKTIKGVFLKTVALKSRFST